MKGINIFLAEGFEDIEALAPCDILRRAGLPARLVSISGKREVRSAHGVGFVADCLLSELESGAGGVCERDFMIFPGGMPGARYLSECEPLMAAMQAHYDAGGNLAAICAAPGLVLSQLDGIVGAQVTCYDGFEGLLEAAGAEFVPRAAVRSGRIVTGRGPGHAVAFGLEILRVAAPEKAAAVQAGLIFPTLS